MNQTLTEVLELRRFAEDRMEVHLLEVNAADTMQRRKVFNERLIAYIDELNEKCREINGADCNDGQERFKSMHALINDFQNRFMARY
ncbi:hypothetical protein D3H65_04835 [Paraflavitalea soli]|uniref:Uncharacterized protein n=1 Tax=Paraflavitalea soli TaxID=2315862 RepID=A0A3B7MJZ1_9BACT|nr:hypothetical protein [Paraflavitalea soli]AXY73346.1 hypothetical protein D3H65_04835 [Paraflavitalea soli]